MIERSLDKCNVLKINDEELVIVNRLFGYPGIDLQDTCRTLIARYGLRYLILTLGANGSYVFPQHGEAAESGGRRHGGRRRLVHGRVLLGSAAR